MRVPGRLHKARFREFRSTQARIAPAIVYRTFSDLCKHVISGSSVIGSAYNPTAVKTRNREFAFFGPCDLLQAAPRFYLRNLTCSAVVVFSAPLLTSF